MSAQTGDFSLTVVDLEIGPNVSCAALKALPIGGGIVITMPRLRMSVTLIASRYTPSLSACGGERVLALAIQHRDEIGQVPIAVGVLVAIVML